MDLATAVVKYLPGIRSDHIQRADKLSPDPAETDT